MATAKQLLDDNLHWYKDAIIYELHIKAFRDGNGDGIGDFEGLLQKLDYLQDLGVTAIWVLPFYPSPLRDDGYDIADYYTINPTYGTIQQFKNFLAEAHRRNIKVITELVINHTSDQHPWFQRARLAPKDSPERNYYVWSDDPGKYKDVRIIFQDFETSNWTWDPVAKQYYWHRFFHHQPDLNYDSPLIEEEIFKIVDYWCAMGVDGFRLDAVPYLFEREGTNGENLPETHAFLKKLRKYIDTHYPSTVFLAEANMWPEDSASYFGNGDECHMNYHFPVMPRMFMALQMEDRYPITDIFDQTPDIPPTCQWAMFLRNHDELTLEMVTDEERDYMYKVYAKDPKARINLGIRHRLAPLMDNDRKKTELLNCLLFSMPGTPVIYYGDEIGMGDNFYLGDRDGVRTPMQWSPDRNAGFSSANPQKLYLPLILDPEYHYEAVNVEMQQRNTSSLYWYMKRMISMRKKYKAFGRGVMKFLNLENPKVLAFTRTYEDETLLIVVNLSKFSQFAELDLDAFKGQVPVELFSRNHFPLIKEETPYVFTLAPYTYHWFVLEKVQEAAQSLFAYPSVQINTWQEITGPAMMERLETLLLPAYFQKSKWMGARARDFHHLSIIKKAALPLGDYSALILLIEVNYQSGLAETYQLAISFVKEEAAKKLLQNCPQAIIATMKTGEAEGVLCDALFTAGMQQAILKHMSGNETIISGDTAIRFSSTASLKKYLDETTEAKARIQASGRNHTALSYNNRYYLKMYRKTDLAVNPDMEITRFLSEEVHFEHIPAYVGAIEWQDNQGTVGLGMMQVMVENHGDGYTYVVERLNNYIERILARDKGSLHPQERIGTLINPVAYEQLPEPLQVLLGSPAAEQTTLLGKRAGEMHLALASATQLRDFSTEDFSLHYQRSLFSSMQSLVRETYQSLEKNAAHLPVSVQPMAAELLNKRALILQMLQKIYNKKLDVVKTRIHGNFRLNKILMTGKDIAIDDFGGDPSRSYSERRLKRSPLRDIASMITSFHYVAHESFLVNSHAFKEEDKQYLMPFASMWAFYISGFFIKAYIKTVEGSAFVPADPADLEMMLRTYLLQKAVDDLNDELNNRPEWAVVPLQLISSLIA